METQVAVDERGHESKTLSRRERLWKIGQIWLLLLLSPFLLGSFDLTHPLLLTGFPLAPREGEPFTASIALQNPGVDGEAYAYEVFQDGVQVLSGTVSLPPRASKEIQHATRGLGLGEQVHYSVRARSLITDREYREDLSIPPYPPQIWSSFVSFATFSTSLVSFSASMGMSSSMGLTSVTYYQEGFGVNTLNVGAILSIFLITFLVFGELTEPLRKGKNFPKRFGIRLRRLSLILFSVFLAMVYTQMMMVLGWIGGI
jgi:hypothetical protein